MAEAFIVRRGGGGGSGGTLVVTSSGAGTVTVSNSALDKSYSKSVTAGGSVIFKGLKTGEWTVTLSNGAQTVTRSVAINADYSVSVAYFSATISITYPAKSNCTVKTSGGTTVASNSNTGSSTKTWTATVNATGTYTVTATATDGSGKSKSTTVSITADGQSKSVTLSYNLMLYDAGDQFAEVTGGWSYTGGNSPVFNANNIVVEPTVENGTCVLTTANKINLTGIKTLHFYLKCDTTGSLSNGGNCQAVGAHTSNAIRVDNNRMTADVKVPKTADYKDYTVDVSALSGSYYILVATLSAERVWYAKLTVSKIWGEYA